LLTGGSALGADTAWLAAADWGGLMGGVVVSVSQCGTHRFSKPPRMWIRLLAGLGVEGDAHLGTTVKHRSRVAKDPTQPNLRQVHLVHVELLAELEAAGFVVGPGDIGENVLTRGVDLLALPTDTVLRIGEAASVRVTGLRNPCVQLDRFRPGLMKATLDRDAAGGLVRKAGVMAVVLTSGEVRPGDRIEVAFPAGAYRRLQPV
jgi:MOSC domain